MESDPFNPLRSTCGAKTRKGAPCKSHPVTGRKRCRMHGGASTGAPKGNRNAWKHGGRSADHIALLRQMRALLAGNVEGDTRAGVRLNLPRP